MSHIERWNNEKVTVEIWLPDYKPDVIYVEYEAYLKDRKRNLPTTGAYFHHPSGDDGQGLKDLRVLLIALGLKKEEEEKDE